MLSGKGRELYWRTSSGCGAARRTMMCHDGLVVVPYLIHTKPVQYILHYIFELYLLYINLCMTSKYTMHD